MATLTPIEAISAILRAQLRGEPLPPGLKSKIEKSAKCDIDWVRTASRHRIGPALGSCLDDLDLKDVLSPDLALYFQTMANGNDEQNACFLDELAEITEALNHHGIEPCLLKGAAILVSEIYPDSRWRFMNDIDLLFTKEESAFAWDTLRSLGYQVYANSVIDGKSHHHEKPLWHPDKFAYVELHHQICRPRHSRILSAETLLKRARSFDHPLIGRISLPHIDDLATMVITHAQISDNHARYGTFRLIDLAEFDVLTTHHGADPKVITERFRQSGFAHQCLAFYSLSDRLLSTQAIATEAIPARAALTARWALWLQGCRPALVASIMAGWMLRTMEQLLLDGDWRWIFRRVALRVSDNRRSLLFSLRRALRNFS